MCLASHEDNVIADSLQCHEISAPPIRNTYPIVLFLSLLPSHQSKSQ